MQYAMKRLTATNTTPVTQNVRLTVSSIIVQLDAIGVNHQGLKKWNRTVPMTKAITAHASIIAPPCEQTLARGSNAWCRSLRNSRHVAERIDEVRIDRHQFGVRMFFTHHLEHDRFSMRSEEHTSE